MLDVEEGGRYGWPYCYDDGKASPEYSKADCSRFRVPLLLIAAHAAPLGMTYYFGNLLPEPRGALIVGYHGYRAKGHRIGVFETDRGGLPSGKSSELVAGWDAVDGRPMGVPTDLKAGAGADGALYVTEGRNGTVVRIARQQ